MNLPSNDASIGCSAERENHVTLGLGITIHIVDSSGSIGVVVMGYIINLPFVEELLIDYPWRLLNDFVYPSTMPDSFAPEGAQRTIILQVKVRYLSACDITVGALCSLTCASEFTPTSR